MFGAGGAPGVVCRSAGAVALAACTRARRPCIFLPRPARSFSDWHVVFAMAGDLALNERRRALRSQYAAVQRLRAQAAHRCGCRAARRAKYVGERELSIFPSAPSSARPSTTRAPAGARQPRNGRAHPIAGIFSGQGLDLANVRLIETRLLVRREHGWEALALCVECRANRRGARAHRR